MKQARGDEIQLVSVYIFFVSKQPTINSSKILIMNCDRAEKAEKASHPGNLPTSLLLISRMKKSWRKKRVFLEFFSLFCFSFWFLNLIHSYNMGILQKKIGSKRPFLPEIDAQIFWYAPKRGCHRLLNKQLSRAIS